jgi:glycosyltransferase involved in cell wall biosynthesis
VKGSQVKGNKVKGSNMNLKADAFKSVISHIRNAGLYSALNAELNLPSLFVYRYLLDKPNDIVNLQKDIQDLPFFPERLNASYQDEWIVFCKKAVSKLGFKALSKPDLAFLTDELNADDPRRAIDHQYQRPETLILLKKRLMYMQESEEFDKQFEQLCQIESLLSNNEVAILKSQQQRKIEDFIK